jgi:hypothetical protein
MWGVFQSRQAVNRWIFREEGCAEDITVWASFYPPPLLRSVRYKLLKTRFGDTELLDAQRLPFAVVQPLYFPTSPGATVCTSEVIKRQQGKPAAVLRWLRFDLEEVLQRLVPHRSAKLYFELVRAGDFTALVRGFGGVDPLVLRRFRAVSEDLVQEAVLLAHLTALTVTHRTVWLSETQCVRILVENAAHQSAFRRLCDAGAVRMEVNSECLALAWAAEQLAAAPPSSSALHEFGKPLVAMSEWSGGALVTDFCAAVDPWVHRKTLPTSMLPRPAEMAEECPLSGSLVRVDTLKAALAYVAEALGKYSTCITFSEEGRVRAQPLRGVRANTCVLDEAVVSVQGAALVGGGSPVVLERCRVADALPFRDALAVAALPGNDVIIALFFDPKELRWLSSFHRTTAKKTMLLYVNKGGGV